MKQTQQDNRPRAERASKPLPRVKPLAAAIATVLWAAGLGTPAQAQSNWFAAGSQAGAQSRALQRGPMPGVPLPTAARQQIEARQQLSQSIANLNRTANAIAAQQASQEAARARARDEPSVPDGLGVGGLQVAQGAKAGWEGADTAVPTTEAGRHIVTVKQTASRAILNWETFNVGRNTTLRFDQQRASDAVLNKVVGADAKPSQIQGQIQAAGTVMIVNQNGVVFSGTSQVNVRNLVAAAAKPDASLDTQFRNNGLYTDATGTQPIFREALGSIIVQAGARLTTHEAGSVTQGGGYALLLGAEVHNAGTISTPKGQTVLAAGDTFYIRKGVGTEGNQQSTTRGNEVSAHRLFADTVGAVSNSGLVTATTGDITLTGHLVTQAGVLISTTSQAQRGTIHLSTRASDTTGRISFAPGSTTAIVLDEAAATALDSQRDAALTGLTGANPGGNPLANGNFDNLSTLADRLDLSRIEVVSGNTAEFQSESLALATGGQISVKAAKRTMVNAGAELDVAGAIGVRIAMESNNLNINVQGNEQRDAPVNREGGRLNNAGVWVDRRSLVFIPAGTNGYETDRWYTAGGLLEVSGYLATSGRSVDEWMAQGGVVTFSGADLVTHAGSNMNLSGGTLDVQDGQIRQSWLRGADGRLYEVSRAPGDILYEGLYRGYEVASARWGENATRRFYDPMLAPTSRFEAGYTVGRDAGKLIVATSSAVLEGGLTTEVYQGIRQTQAAQPGLDGYYQSQSAVARRGQLVVGDYVARYDATAGMLRHTLNAVVDRLMITEADALSAGLTLDDPIGDRTGKLVLDASTLNGFRLGALRTAARSNITVERPLGLDTGGEIVLYAPEVSINADIVARAGTVHAGNVLNQWSTLNNGSLQDSTLLAPESARAVVVVKDGATVDVSGLWVNQRLDPEDKASLSYRDGGHISLRSNADVTLERGSHLDVSSGASLLESGSLSGGRGGNVTLQTGVGASPAADGGTLALDGTLSGHGVKGGGTLMLQTGGTVIVGGQSTITSGYLESGEAAPISLALREPITLSAGDILPIAASYTRAVAGQVLAAPLRFTNTGATLSVTVGAGGWDLNGTNMDVYVGNTRYRGATGTARVVPPGAVITRINAGTLPEGYVIPSSLASLPTPSYSVAAGTPALMETVIPAGTLLAAGSVLEQRVGVREPLMLDGALFRRGFSDYVVIGKQGMFLPEMADIRPSVPVYRFAEHSASVAGGSAIAQALELWTPPLYGENHRQGVLSQREGASLTLQAGATTSVAGDMAKVSALVSKGAHVEVDPGQSITLRSIGQLTVNGQLHAPSGRIFLSNFTVGAAGLGNTAPGEAVGHGRSIWVGDEAVLDVSARAASSVDPLGRRYGFVSDGGSIILGGEINHQTGSTTSPHVFVVVQEGAVLNASGDQSEFDVPGQGMRRVASAGGRIALSSMNGVYLEGKVQAHAGGEGAAGGTLELALDTPLYLLSNAPDRVRVHRELVVSQTREATVIPGDGTPGDAANQLQYGKASLAAEQVGAGGFGNLSLYVNGILSFDGDVSLAMAQSLRLYAGALGVSETQVAPSLVSLSAPHVQLAGALSPVLFDGALWPTVTTGFSQQERVSSLQIKGGLIDFRDAVSVGARGSIQRTSGTVTVDRAGFESVLFESSGDIRFLKASRSEATAMTSVDAGGDIVLRAAQVYPTTHAKAQVRAGYIEDGTYRADGSLRIEPVGTGSLLPPYSVFGQLTLGAAQVQQGGVVRAPLGSIVLGTRGGQGETDVVALLPGSLTSVSAQGLWIPYGGTLDGLTYRYGADEVTFIGAGGATASAQLIRGIELVGKSFSVEPEAILDLSGGGELLGAGFVSGRGGSTDARFNPLVRTAQGGGFELPSLAENPVYAIVPGSQTHQAPIAPEGGAVSPLVGQQITIGAGVPGLAAGTYTLMPSTYALMPGAFRVEIHQGNPLLAMQAGAHALRNGSWLTQGNVSIAGTGIKSGLLHPVTLTAVDVLRTYSEYNVTSYAEFAKTSALRLGVPNPMLPADSALLMLRLENGAPANALKMQGQALFQPAEGGRRGGAIVVSSMLNGIEIVADAATAGFSGVSVSARDLNALQAPTLWVGGIPYVEYGAGGRMIQFTSVDTGVYVRENARIEAAEVILLGRKNQTQESDDEGVVIAPGASINTIRKGAASFGSEDGFVYQPGQSAMVAVSNSVLQTLAPDAPDSNFAPAAIRLGGCTANACTGNTLLYSEGSIVLATNNQFELGTDVRYGTENLTLAVGSVNIGSQADLAALAGRGSLSAGLTMDQSVLDRLLQGDDDHGAPALKTLNLTARDSVNFFGSTGLSTLDASGVSTLENLVLSTPAIYGYGERGEIASIETGHFIWQGATQAPGAIVSQGAGTGEGALDIRARQVTFGYGPRSPANGDEVFKRLTLGFDTVNVIASEKVTANHQGSLSVYRARNGFSDGVAQYSAGNLNLVTPLITAAAGSVHHIVAGGVVTLTAPQGATPLSTGILQEGLGAELAFEGERLVLDTSVLLPSGKLGLTAQADVLLTDRASVDMAGRGVQLGDVVRYSWGGDVSLSSRAGNIRQAAGSVIDLSAQQNQAGLLTAIAFGQDAGVVDLQGRIEGSASGHYDAGGTWVPYRAGGVDVRAQRLGDTGLLTEHFAALNQRLNTGGISGIRSFQLKRGDLSIANDIRAGEVSVSLDDGHLTVLGRIDASGERVGVIRLAGKNGLTLAGQAELDAHGTVLRMDSYKKIIDAPNRAIVELSSGDGILTLGEGVRIDLRHGTDALVGTAPGQADGVSRGTLILYAPRLGAQGGVTDIDADIHGDIGVNVPGAVDIVGASAIVLNAMARYDDAPLGTDPTADEGSYQYIDDNYLSQKHGRSTVFMAAALANANLMAGRLAGLNTASYQEALHLRPGLEIVSNEAINPDQRIVVQGDLDLSKYRYAGVNPRYPLTPVDGSGEPGTLIIRAGGDLDIYGSITDGFAAPPDTADLDGNGWILVAGVQPYGGDLIVPGAGVELAEGTEYAPGKVLNYDLPVQGMTLPAGNVLPVQGTLGEALTLPAQTVLHATVRDGNGNVLFEAGTVLQVAVTFPVDTLVDAGSRFSAGIALKPLTWPKGVALPTAMKLSRTLPLGIGAIIPANTSVVLPDGASSIPLRAENGGAQGKNWALAPMLSEGSLSWGMRLVAGADVAAADTRATLPAAGGGVNLADTHYGTLKTDAGGGGLVWAPGNPFNMPAGTPVTDEWLPVCANIPGVCVPANAGGGRLVWAPGNPFSMPAGTPVTDEWLPVCQNMPGVCVEEEAPEAAPYPLYSGVSVLRTGTGDLDVIAAASIQMHSPYGVYTAGTQASDVAAGYLQPRGTQGDGSVLGAAGTDYEAFVASGSTYQAWYPEQGGNVMVRAGGDILGDSVGLRSLPWAGERSQRPSNSVGNWLWRQGTGNTQTSQPVPTSWWINFGTYATNPASATEENGEYPHLIGFNGIGTLGGGNLTVTSGGAVGALTRRGSDNGENSPRSTGLTLAVGATGRVLGNGDILFTGGGDLSLNAGRGVNTAQHARGHMTGGIELERYWLEKHDLNGALVNIRGAVDMNAGSVGGVLPLFGSTLDVQDRNETRGFDPFVSTRAIATGGLVLVPGDSTFNLNTRRDLVIGGAADPGRVHVLNSSPYGGQGGGGQTWFSLWTDRTAINLLSAGGNLAPITLSDTVASRTGTAPIFELDTAPSDGAFVLPSGFSAVAASGSFYFGPSGSFYSGREANYLPYGILLAPSRNVDARFELIAAESIYAGGFFVSRSSASASALATPLRPAFVGHDATGTVVADNLAGYGLAYNRAGRYPLISFGPNTPSLATTRYRDPMRVYAASGDIVGLGTGAIYQYEDVTSPLNGQTWHTGGSPIRMYAGRDIVRSGLQLGESLRIPSELGGVQVGRSAGRLTGNLIVHQDASDISVVEAGRDIVRSTFNIVGPGVLEISAGRHIAMESFGSVTSMGAAWQGDSRPGASVVMQAGMDRQHGDFTSFLSRYLTVENLADPDRALAEQEGKVVRTYEAELSTWLNERYGFSGTSSEALAYFFALPSEQQRVFARSIYFAELKAGGREFNDPNSARQGSYLRGRNAIAALFPEHNAQGEAIVYQGDLLIYGNAGIHTQLGGDIQILTPGGAQTFGMEGPSPASTAGVITQGRGDIQLYARDSILLGQSRVMTTFGGSILAWSAQGDINAGRGAKTTVVFTPPRRVYDAVGNVTLSPDVPSTGAGIATLAPIPEVPGGSVDLIAPEGTVDAGEAGIRSSDSVNIAALRVVNAENIQAQGDVSGVPMVAAVNIGALTNASAAATSAADAAQDTVARSRAAARQALPSIISVQILGFGEEGAATPAAPSVPARQSSIMPTRYDASSTMQLVGNGPLSESQRGQLTDRERANAL
ncbi:Filamentous haemagglutinin family outer membrane protein associated with VreARI signalling system [plant metagenome]|uniref:Filamentous haemagglutinin family outer membrane protein associated with VreARI signalling system n=1 Tax=plant metagenome TaxID=1297885 RepID=A0A484TT41_9ZZZZ